MTENISRKGPQNRRSLHGAPGQVGFAPNDKVEGGWFPVGIGLRDPRSQKRDLGHPSISPFDIAEGTCFVISLPTRLSGSSARDDNWERSAVEKHFQEGPRNCRSLDCARDDK